MSYRCSIDQLFSYFLSHLRLTSSTYHLPFLVTLVVWLLGQSLRCIYLTSVKLVYMTLLYRTVVNMSRTSRASTQMTHWVFNVLNPHCQVYLYYDMVRMFRLTCITPCHYPELGLGLFVLCVPESSAAIQPGVALK